MIIPAILWTDGTHYVIPRTPGEGTPYGLVTLKGGIPSPVMPLSRIPAQGQTFLPPSLALSPALRVLIRRLYRSYRTHGHSLTSARAGISEAMQDISRNP